MFAGRDPCCPAGGAERGDFVLMDNEKLFDLDNMRQRYEGISLVALRDMAKARGLKGTSGMKKAALIEVMLEEDRKHNEETIRNQVRRQIEAVDERKNASGEGKEKREEKGIEEGTPASRGGRPENGQRRDVRARKLISRTASQESQGRGEHATRGERYTKEEQGAQNTQTVSMPQTTQSTQNTQTAQNAQNTQNTQNTQSADSSWSMDSGKVARGILEVMSDGYGFIRCENFLPGDNDVYVSPAQIRKFGLKTGDVLEGHMKVKASTEKFQALLYLTSVNDMSFDALANRYNFEDMVPIFPREKIHLEAPGAPVSMRIMDLICPVGKGQRGMIVAQPKAGKTTLLKNVAKSIKVNHPEIHMIILLIDERPEEVTDMIEEVGGDGVEVIYSTFDETPEHHKRVSEMVIERARRLVEYKKDVVILLDSITRLTRAYNQVVPPSGRTLSGGLDPAALHMPKRFFGAARKMREGGSLTILATALVETGSKMDDVVYEEFKGTGNMEMVLDRKLSERRVFPAIDILKSSTRREDLLLTNEEMAAIDHIRKAVNLSRQDDVVDRVIDMFARTHNNEEFVRTIQKINF